MASTAVYEILQYFINIVGSNITMEIIPFIKILLIEMVFNAILTIILYPIIQKVGFYIEGEFKEKNILTRYWPSLVFLIKPSRRGLEKKL
jgi:hypothetical protein